MGRDARPARLILAEAEDLAAVWLAEGLLERGLAVELVSPTQLCAAPTLDHRLTEVNASFRIALVDGRVLDSRAITGVINRMVRVPIAALARSEPDDRTYVEAEWRALLCSLLGALPGRVLDAPHPHSLVGRWRSTPEWLLLAHQAGMPTPQWQWTEGAHAPRSDMDAEGDGFRVLVIGDDLVPLESTPAVPAEVVAGCQRLATLAGTSALEIRLGDDGPLTFVSANQLPDLREGGDRVVAAFARMLES